MTHDKHIFINIPGLHNSGEDHWQTHFEKQRPSEFKRIIQENWDEPDCERWIDRIDLELQGMDHSNLILIGHSIGCIAIVKWFEKYRRLIKGAMLVAPSDSERDGYPTYISGFTPIPNFKLPFPSIVVASTDDHVTDPKRSHELAENWGSKLILLENAGHIEPKSGFGKWDFGFELLNTLETGSINNT
jgi:predicted alpha/beta hydrolase family esterase